MSIENHPREPLPPHLERFGHQLTAAAGDLYGSRTRRHHWSRRQVIVMLFVSVLASTGIAAAAVIPTFIATHRHETFAPGFNHKMHAIDHCWISAGGELRICSSAVGTTLVARNAAGRYVAPSGCSFHGQIETCRKPVHFTIDLADQKHPKLLAQGGS